MTEAQRDQMITDIHAQMAVLVDHDQSYHATLYGNGRPGLAADVQRISDAQDHCVARKAFSEGGRSLKAVWLGIVLAAVVGLPGMIRELISLFKP